MLMIKWAFYYINLANFDYFWKKMSIIGFNIDDFALVIALLFRWGSQFAFVIVLLLLNFEWFNTIISLILIRVLNWILFGFLEVDLSELFLVPFFVLFCCLN